MPVPPLAVVVIWPSELPTQLMSAPLKLLVMAALLLRAGGAVMVSGEAAREQLLPSETVTV